MIEHSDAKCTFSLIRYSPDPIRNEAVNIGIIIKPDSGSSPIEVRCLRDWRKVIAIDPEADVEMLGAIQSDLQDELNRDPLVLDHLLDQWSNSIYLTPPKGSSVSTLDLNIDFLMGMYVERETSPPALGRVFIKNQIKEHFKRVGVWDKLARDIPVSRYTWAGDPLRIDYGYHASGVMKLIQAVSLESTGQAAVFALAAPQLYEGVERVDNSALDLIAIVDSPLGMLGNPEQAAMYHFCYNTMAEQRIRVIPVEGLGTLAINVGRELTV